MKAVIIEKIGEITYREVKDSDVYMPTDEEDIEHGTEMYSLSVDREPGEGEIAVESVLGAICTHEVSLFKGDLTHPRYPMVPGHEAVHRVLAVGKGVTHLKPGDYCACCWYMGQWSRRLVGPAEFAYKLPPGDQSDFKRKSGYSDCYRPAQGRRGRKCAFGKRNRR